MSEAIKKTIESDGVTIDVSPLGFVQFTEHAEAITRIIGRISAVEWSKFTDPAMTMQAVATIFGAAVLKDVLGIVNDCCEPTLRASNASLGLTARAFAAWFELTFGGDNPKKLLAALEQMIGVVSGQPVNLQSRTGSPTASLLSSPSAIPGKTSSIVPGATGSATAAGAIPSSRPGSAPPTGT